MKDNLGPLLKPTVPPIGKPSLIGSPDGQANHVCTAVTAQCPATTQSANVVLGSTHRSDITSQAKILTSASISDHSKSVPRTRFAGCVVSSKIVIMSESANAANGQLRRSADICVPSHCTAKLMGCARMLLRHKRHQIVLKYIFNIERRS